MGASVLRAFIIGCGNVAGGYDLRGGNREVWTHAKAYQLTPGVELVGVIDSSPTIARRFAKTWRVAFSGTKLLPALERINPDIVSICSPTHTHVPLIKDLCRAGVRGILCEKPIAYDLRTAEQAVELCDKNGVLLVVNYQRNWDRQLNQLGAKIHLGEFGSAELIRVLYSKGLIHNGSHFISLLDQWFGGLEITRILSAERYDQDDVIADFTATCPAVNRIIFQNVSEQSYVLNEIEVLFERGRLELRRGGLDIYWTDRNSDPLLPKEMMLSKKAKKLPGTLPRAMLEVIRNFVSAARGNEKLESDARAALRTLRFCVRVRNRVRSRNI